MLSNLFIDFNARSKVKCQVSRSATERKLGGKIHTAIHRRQTALSFGTTFSQPQNLHIPTH